MARLTPEELSAACARNGRIGANVSWARTPHRAERTAPARRRSPLSLDYWLAKTEAEGIVRAEDVEAAAENAWRAYQAQMSRKGVEARRRKAATNQPSPERTPHA